MTMEIQGKVVLITGAGSGIGRATAFAFAERGAALVLADVQAEGLERTALLARKLGASVVTQIVDVAAPEAMEAFAQRVHDRYSAVDVLINNAGIGVAGSFVGTPLSAWNRAMNINVMGVVHGCHFFLPKMIERGTGGHVVNVASAAGLAAPKQMPVYAATKFAVVGLSESLRAELAPHHIGVTALCPGVINTPIARNVELTGDLANQRGFHDRASKLYRRRNYGPEKVAEAMVDAVRHGKGLVPVAPESWALYYGKRLAPRVVEKILALDMP